MNWILAEKVVRCVWDGPKWLLRWISINMTKMFIYFLWAAVNSKPPPDSPATRNMFSTHYNIFKKSLQPNNWLSALSSGWWSQRPKQPQMAFMGIRLLDGGYFPPWDRHKPLTKPEPNPRNHRGNSWRTVKTRWNENWLLHKELRH